MTAKEPTANSKGLRLGSFDQIRGIIDEELEAIWSGDKTAQEAMDSAKERGDALLRRFEQPTAKHSDQGRPRWPACFADRGSHGKTRHFPGWWLPLLLIMPQVLISAVFFFYPAGQAIWQSLFIPDPFGLSSQFVGLGNFEFLLGDKFYRASFVTTAIFSILVTLCSMIPALFLAVHGRSADQRVRCLSHAC